MTDRSAPVVDPAARLATARRAFAAVRSQVVAGEPWPLADQFGSEPEASWGPREVLAHTAEMLPFWLGEFERVVEAGSRPGGPIPFGRTSGDTLRTGILERDRTLPLRDLFDRIDSGIERWERRLASGSASEADARGLHPRLGEIPASHIRDRFVVTHLEEHIAQLEEILARR